LARSSTSVAEPRQRLPGKIRLQRQQQRRPGCLCRRARVPRWSVPSLARNEDRAAAHDDSASTHSRKHFTDALVDFFEPDDLGLERAMKCSVDWPESECDEVRIFLERLL